MATADTVSAMQALAVPTSDYVCVLRGRGTTEDGLGGTFVWYPNLVQAENGGTVVKPSELTSGQAGRWVRQYSGAANLQWFGADPTGVADSTAAFVAAFAATHTGQTILVPLGTYLLQPDHATFKFWSRRWQGENAHAVASNQTTIKPTTNGSKLAWLSGVGHVSGITFDADGLCEYGLYCGAAHWSTVEDCHFRGATEAGLIIYQSSMSGRNLTAEYCRRGIVLRGANGSAFWFVNALNCTGTGLLIEGNYSGNTTQSGSVKVDGGVIDICCTEYTDEALIELNGVEQAWLTGMYVEGDAVGVRLSGLSHNCTLRDMRFVLSGVAIDMFSARGCLIEACAAPNQAGGIVVHTMPDHSTSYYNDFVNNRAISAIAPQGMSITFVDDSGANANWTSQKTQGEWVSATPPTAGLWVVGDRVGAYQCTVVGYPGTWVAIDAGNLPEAVDAGVAAVSGSDGKWATAADIRSMLNSVKAAL